MYVVYAWTVAGRIMYVGIGPLSRAFDKHAGQLCGIEAAKVIAEGGRVDVEILVEGLTVAEAAAVEALAIRLESPPWNVARPAVRYSLGDRWDRPDRFRANAPIKSYQVKHHGKWYDYDEPDRPDYFW